MLKLLEIIPPPKKRRYAQREQPRWQSKRTPSSPPLMNTPKTLQSAKQPLLKKPKTHYERSTANSVKREIQQDGRRGGSAI